MSPLAWMFGLAGLVSLDSRIMAPILPAIARSLGVSAGEVGLAVTAYTLAYGLMQVVYGPLSDRYGRLPVVRGAAALFAVGTGASAVALSLPWFVTARLVTGMFAAAVIPTTFAYIGDTIHYGERQKVLGGFAVISSGAQALSATLAGTVTFFVSWRLLFAIYAVLTALTVAAMLRLRATPPPRRGTIRLRYVDILRLAAARRTYLAVFTEGFFIWGGSTYLGVLAYRRFGWNDLQIGVLIAAYGVGTITAGVLLSRLAPRVGERRLAIAGGLLQGVGFAVLTARLPWPCFAASLFAIGLGLACLHSTLQTRGTELAPAARGKAFAGFALAYFLGGAVGTAALGAMVDAGLIRLAMAACGLGLVAVGAFTAREP